MAFYALCDELHNYLAIGHTLNDYSRDNIWFRERITSDTVFFKKLEEAERTQSYLGKLGYKVSIKTFNFSQPPQMFRAMLSVFVLKNNLSGRYLHSVPNVPDTDNIAQAQQFSDLEIAKLEEVAYNGIYKVFELRITESKQCIS